VAKAITNTDAVLVLAKATTNTDAVQVAVEATTMTDAIQVVTEATTSANTLQVAAEATNTDSIRVVTARADEAQLSVPDAPADTSSKIYLEPSLEIKDVEVAHRRLMAILAFGTALTVDLSRVAAVDTAGAQLLVAFQSEAAKRGMSLEFCGESAALTHALTMLGLRDAVQIAISRD